MSQREFSWVPIVALSLILIGAECFLLATGTVHGEAVRLASPAAGEAPEHYAAFTYATTALANVAYCPAKLLLAGLGVVVSGVSYLVTMGSSEPMELIWSASVGGDYLLTPGMLEGRQPFRFIDRCVAENGDPC